MATVTFDHVTKAYADDAIAVNDLDLLIKDGEFPVLVGPSGCGKTTALRCLAGLEEITGGNILIGEKVVNDLPPKQRDIAMVFQSYALYPHMSVYDNMAFSIRLHKLPKADVDAKVRDAARILDLEKLLDRKPGQLSGGQRQRVALGRAIVRDPATFLMDEPLSNPDAKLRVQTRAEIARLHQRLGTTFVYVTHDQVEAMTMGTRIAVMSEGILQQVGPPQELYDHPVNRFVAGFIGSPAMNFVEVNITGSGDGLVLEAHGLRVPIPARLRDAVGTTSGRKIIAGFRPDHIDLGQPDPNVATLAGTADVVEYLGAQELLHISAADKDIVAIIDAGHRVKPGDNLNLWVPLDKVHMFDAESGLSLTAQAQPVAA